MRRELGVAQKDKSAFIKEFSESDYNAIEAGWKVSLTSSSASCSLEKRILPLLPSAVKRGFFRGQQQYRHRAQQGMIAQLRRFGSDASPVLFSLVLLAPVAVVLAEFRTCAPVNGT